MFRVKSPLTPTLFAQFLAGILEPEEPGWEPVRIYQGRDDRWQLDQHNDWWLSVHVPGVYSVGHRSGNSQHLKALALKLELKHRLEVIYV